MGTQPAAPGVDVCRLFAPFGRTGKHFTDWVDRDLGREYTEPHERMLERLYHSLDDDRIAAALADMCTVWFNAKAYSFMWEAARPYSTPQDGEHKLHQKMLEIFLSVNGGIVDSTPEYNY